MAPVLPHNEKATSSRTPITPESKHDVEAVGTPNWDQDVAMAVVGEHALAIDPVVEAQVIKKIDRFMIPAMIIGYGFVYYDKVDFTVSVMALIADHVSRQFLALQYSLV
jgi:hypothetical protein